MNGFVFQAFIYLLAAIVSVLVAKRLGLGSVLGYLIAGVLIGPVLHWVNPDVFRGATHGFGSLALILILFEGGLDLKLREIQI